MPEHYIFDPLAVNIQSQHEHGAGLTVIKDPPYTDAATHYIRGLAFLGVQGADLNSLERGDMEPSEVPRLPESVQASGLLRDLAVARMRWALSTNENDGSVDGINRAANLISAAEYIPKTVLGRISDGEWLDDEGIRSVVAARGVSRAVALRLAGAELTHAVSGELAFDDEMLGLLFPGAADLSDRNGLAEEVAEELFGGNNGYWLVSHIGVSMRALRAAGLSNDAAEMDAWRKRQSDALKFTLRYDPRQLPRSVATAARHRWSRRSVEAAQRDAGSPQQL